MRLLLVLAGLAMIVGLFLAMASPAPAATAPTEARAALAAPPPSDFTSRMRDKAIKRTVDACTGHSYPWYCQRYNVRSCWRTVGWTGFCTAWYLVKKVTTGEWRCFDGLVDMRWNGSNVDVTAVVFNWYRDLTVCQG